MSFERQKDEENGKELSEMKNGTAVNTSINSNSDSF